MSDVVIKAEGLGKKYVIGHESQREDYVALRDVLARNARSMVRSARDLLTGRQMVAGDVIEDFWALKDVNFEINRGEVVGIIGRNGAGKSTLLKILSRITEPSKGRVTIKGRVASLLEVGTGFHPELTGRENIFLNGAILGMSQAEIKRKFDEIVDFAEVERFLDTPVKRYSSGMYVRLAFAVAAHLEPEILVVDEVLAVGDVKFQEKCLGKMQNVAGQGRTVLFVSHNTSAIRRLCTRGILLSHGKIIGYGSADEIISQYLNAVSESERNALEDVSKLIESFPADPACRLHHVSLLQDGSPPVCVESDKPLEIVFEYEVLQDTYGLTAFFVLFDNEESVLFESFDCCEMENIPTVEAGIYKNVATIPGKLLKPGRYTIALNIGVTYGRNCLPDYIRIPFNVELTGTINQCFVGYTPKGRLLPSIPWDTSKLMTR